MLRNKTKLFLIIMTSLILSGCGLFVKERVVYQCPISATLMEENRIPKIDLETPEDVDAEGLYLYKALGSCNADKNSIKKEVERINNESR